MGFFADFKAFAMRGNVVDLAVGVIIGGAFGAIVTSLVNDIVMPPIGMLTNGVDMKDQFVSLNGIHYDKIAAAKAAGAPLLLYGNFINAVINFLIIALVIFLVVQQISKLFPPPPVPPPPGPTAEEKLLIEIRDLLARNALPPATRQL